MMHSFDVALAEKLGIAEAVLLNHFHFWLCKNRANGDNLHDGKVWTFNSVKAFSELFPYLTKGRIGTALKHLEEAGLIETGNFNRVAYDRTKWYTLTAAGWEIVGEPLPENGNSILRNHEMESQKTENGIAENEQPIPVNTNSTTVNKIKEKPEDVVEAAEVSDELRQALFEFIAHRSEIRKPITARAMRLTISKLQRLGKNDHERTAVINRSIESGWVGVFPLSADGGRRVGSNEAVADYTAALGIAI